MSVPTWLRGISKAQYLMRLYQLNTRLGEIVYGHPKKYRQTYGDNIIKCGLSALNHAQVGNKIYMYPGTSEAEYQDRRKHLEQARGYLDTLSTVAYIFLELTAKCDGVKQDKILKQEEEIGLACVEISNMIKGVLDSDRKVRNTAKKFQKPG